MAFAVGLTGGIGSGKSAVADAFASLGAAVIDTDVIARAFTVSGGRAMPAIRQRFGETVLAPDGSLNRPTMRALAFADDQVRRDLESILHPLIRAQAEAEALGAQHAPYTVFVVPLLVESGTWRNRARRVLVVDCALATQRARLLDRRGLTADTIDRIVSRQATRPQRLAAADDVLVNEATLDDLRGRVGRLDARYRELAQADL